MYRLLFQHGGVARAPFTSDASSLLVGRETGCGLRLTDAGVRDRHASIERRLTGYFLRDLTHSNGVRVNGLIVDEHRLTSGDEVEIGGVRLIFEVAHQPPPERRAFDPWQLLGGAVVVAIVAGQIGLFGWIFAQPHPRNMRTDIVKGKLAKSQDPAPAPPAAAKLLPLVPLEATPTAPVATPEILSRMLKIMRVDRQEGADGATLRIQIKAQVGERQLDPTSAAVSVQCFTAQGKPGAAQWLTVPAGWENFTTKQLTARLPGVAQQTAGYVVRTYYRKQLQDVLAQPPALAAAVPAPAFP